MWCAVSEPVEGVDYKVLPDGTQELIEGPLPVAMVRVYRETLTWWDEAADGELTIPMAVSHAINVLRRPEDPPVMGGYPIERMGDDDTNYDAYHAVLTAFVEGKISLEGKIV